MIGPGTGSGGASHLIDTLIVKVRDLSLVPSIVSEIGGTLTSTIPAIRWARIQIDHAQASDLFLAYERHPDVEEVWFSEAVHPQALSLTATDDPLLAHQYALHRMYVLEAWRHADGTGIKASVCDQGLKTFARTQPEFATKAIDHWNSHFNGTEAIDPYTGEPSGVDATIGVTWLEHGLACMGLLAADGRNDGQGMVGVAPGASLVNMAVWNDTAGDMTTYDIAAGFIYSFDRFGAKVISASLGTPPNPFNIAGTAVNPYTDALGYLQGKALVFMAAGNDGVGSEADGLAAMPSMFARRFNHFSVGCTEVGEMDRPTEYSGFGTTVNVVAPGHEAFTTYYESRSSPHYAGKVPVPWEQAFPGAMVFDGQSTINYRYRFFDGTSAATPLAAGVCTLIWSVNPAMTPGTVRSIMLECLEPGEHWMFPKRFPSAGIPNALRGVLNAKSLANPGTIYPCLSFHGQGVTVEVAGGVATRHLRGNVNADIRGYCTVPVTRVQLWSGTRLVYDGAPGRVKMSGHHLAGGNLKIVAFNANGSAEETCTDIVAHQLPAGRAVAPPRTSSSVVAGVVTLSAESDAHPVRISYRVNGGAWQTYSAPFAASSGIVQFYGVDCLGNIEGGTDHAT